jgi:4-amino-4-deoxy-L-arabinose transferase-like glycosyltransferase
LRSRLRTFPGRLGLIVAGALLVRVLYTVIVARDVSGIGDYFFYHWSANDLAHGRGFIDPFELRFHGRALPTAGHPPLWPFLLAVFSKLGATTTLAHKLVGCAVGTGVVACVGLLGRRVGGETVGLLAAAIAAVYPVLVGADGSLMSESLYGLCVVLAMLAAYRLSDRPGPLPAIGLGLAAGAAALTRGEGLLLLVLLALPVCWLAGGSARRRALLLGVSLLAAAAVILPWSARNSHVFHRGVLISTNDSTVVAGANCARTYSGSEIGGWQIECISTRRRSNEAAQAAIWRRQGLDYARHHAARVPLVAAVRVLRTWDLFQPRRSVVRNEGRPVRMSQLGTAIFYLLAPFAIAGVVLLRRRRERLIILLAPLALVTVSTAIGWGASRFRHAAEPALVVLAAVALAALLERRASRAQRAAPAA